MRHAELWQRVSSSNGNDIVSGDDDNNVSAPGAELKQKQQQPQPRHGDLRDTITVQLREQEALAEQLNKVTNTIVLILYFSSSFRMFVFRFAGVCGPPPR